MASLASQGFAVDVEVESPTSRNGDTSIVFRLTLDDLEVSYTELGDTLCTSMNADGAMFVKPAGADAFLCKVIEIGIPEDATPRLRELNRRVEELQLPPPPPSGEEGTSAAFLPPALGAHLQECGWLRGQRIQSLRIDLAVYHNGHWRILREAEYELSLGTRTQVGAASLIEPESPAFKQLLETRLLNSQSARSWRVDPRLKMAGQQGALRDVTPPWMDDETFYRIGVVEDGICRVTYSWLQQAGVPVEEIVPGWLRLWCGDEEVPLLLRGDADGRFDPGDYFLFVGHYKRGEFIPTDFYSPEQEYFLSWQHGPGLRYVETQATPQDDDVIQVAGLCETHYETNMIWDELAEISEGPNEVDHWFWNAFAAASGPTSGSVSLTVPFPSLERPASARPDGINLFLRGNFTSDKVTTSTYHHLIAWFNELFVADLNGLWQAELASDWVDLPPEAILNGSNTLRFDLPLDRGFTSDLCYLDWVELRYWRQLQLSSSYPQLTVQAEELEEQTLSLAGVAGDVPLLLTESGQRLIGWEVGNESERGRVIRFRLPAGSGELYACELDGVLEPASILVSSNDHLRDTSNQVDMIILAPKMYHESLEDLAEYHGQSMSVKIVDVESVYNEFNYGRMHIDAVKKFLAYAFAEWQGPLPSYLLLVGKTSTANQQNLGRRVAYTTQVPSDWIHTEPYGATSSDETMTYIVGGENDDYQDILVGRISVSSVGQLSDFLLKHREYREQQYAGEWMETQFFVADNHSDYTFEIGNNIIRNHVIPEEYPVKVLEVRTGSDYKGGTLDFLDAVNDGCAVLNYNGHGSIGVLSSSALFRATDLRYLSNRGKYPIGYAWSCLVGYVDNPDTSSLAELLVRKANAGTIAYYGAAAKAYIFLDTPYQSSYFTTHYSEEPYTLGQIVQLTEATMKGIQSGGFNITHMYNLLGDPALYPAHPRKHIHADPAVIVAEDGGSASVVLTTEPPGLSGQLTIKYYEDAKAPVNFVSPLSTTQLSFNDGDTVPLTMPTIGESKRCLARLALQMDNDRATGAIPLFLNTNFAGAGTHSPSVVTVGHPVEFEFNSYAEADTVYLVLHSRSLPGTQVEIYGADVDYLLDDEDHVTCSASMMTSVGGGSYVKSFSELPESAGNAYSIRVYIAALDESKSFNLGGLPYGFNVHHNGEVHYVPGGMIEVNGQEGLVSTDSLFAVEDNGNQQSLEWRWVLGSRAPVDRVARKLQAVFGEDGEPQIVLADTVDAEQGACVFQTLATLAAGSVELTLDLGPAYYEGERIEQLVPLSVEDNFLLITATEGSGGPQSPTDDEHWSLELDAGAVSRSILLEPLQDDRDPLQLREQSSGQPGLGLLDPSSSEGLTMIDLNPRYPDRLTGEADFLNGVIQCELPLGGLYQFTDGVAGDTLKHALAKWIEDRGLWVVLQSETSADSTQEQRTISAMPRLDAGAIWPVVIRDTNGPLIEYTVDGQWYSDGDVIPQSPSLRILVQDEDGVDLGEGGHGPRVYLDDVIQPEETILQGEGTTAIELVWNPGVLDPDGTHVLRIETCDALGNPNTIDIEFTVAGDMGLSFFANHPNPFADQTVFAWELTGVPRSIEMSIYTGSGRCIRTISVAIPRTGYDEYIWDGCDDKGRQVANGVYFLRFCASGNSGNVEEVFKLARLQ